MRTFTWTLFLGMLLVWPSRAQSPAELPLGSAMPMSGESFTNVQGGEASLSALAGGQGTVVVFWSNQCPWVEKYGSRFRALVDEYAQRGFGFVIVNSNDASAYPQESAEQGARQFSAADIPSEVTYLADPSSRLANAFGAERTPHAYVFDGDNTLVYVGTIDDSPGDPDSVRESYLRDALNAVASGSNVSVPKTKAFGCTIKFAG